MVPDGFVRALGGFETLLAGVAPGRMARGARP